MEGKINVILCDEGDDEEEDKAMRTVGRHYFKLIFFSFCLQTIWHYYKDSKECIRCGNSQLITVGKILDMMLFNLNQKRKKKKKTQ